MDTIRLFRLEYLAGRNYLKNNKTLSQSLKKAGHFKENKW